MAIRLAFSINSKEDRKFGGMQQSEIAARAVLRGTNIPKYALDYDDGGGVIGGKSEIYISISLVCYGETRGLN